MALLGRGVKRGGGGNGVAGNTRKAIRGQIRTLFDLGTACGLTDGQLLERFATRRDEGAELAFAALVERHGPMVLRVCRGILRDEHEALDAFQATFLILARKGGSLWVRDSLGPWLHRVACSTAGRARGAAARRRDRERKAVEMAGTRSPDEDHDELAAVIHEEVDRLPERYRAAVVLCDLEGRTCEEAARHLGCPIGTLASRLARGRERLRDRLRRRGLDPRRATGLGVLPWQAPRVPLPPEIVSATAVAASRFVSMTAVPQGAAALLALGVLRSMAIARWIKVASVLLAVGATTTGTVSFVGSGPSVANAQPGARVEAAGVPITEVKPGKFNVVVDERGSLEATNNPVVQCEVEGITTIISIVPEWSQVKKGQLVSQLDDARFRDGLINQEVLVKEAESGAANARLAREVAEIAVREYVDGISPRELKAVTGRITEARTAIEKGVERVKRTRAARERLDRILAVQSRTKEPADIVVDLDIDDRLASAENALAREERELEAALADRDALEKFTKQRTTKQLEIEVAKARLVEMAREASLSLERSKAAKLRSQLASCAVVAPSDGIVVYSKELSTLVANGERIEANATVRLRQKLFSIADIDGPMHVVAQVHEAPVDQLAKGQIARVTVDAYPGESFEGTVEEIAPRPDADINRRTGAKIYPTRVALKKGGPRLLPGMTARVEILVKSLDDVLSVPAQALVKLKDVYHVAVKNADGSIEWPEVVLGPSDGKSVVVTRGLKPGVNVVLDPVPLLSEEQKRTPAPSFPRPTRARQRTPNVDAPTGIVP